MEDYNERNKPSLEKLFGSQLKHYMEFGLLDLLKDVGYSLDSIYVEYEEQMIDETGETANIPIVKFSVINKCGVVSYRKLFPRLIDSRVNIKEGKLNDVRIRFSITPDGKSFFTPCWISAVYEDEEIRLAGTRIDWDKLHCLVGKEIFISKDSILKKVSSSISLFRDSVVTYFSVWLNEGLYHEDFDKF